VVPEPAESQTDPTLVVDLRQDMKCFDDLFTVAGQPQYQVSDCPVLSPSPSPRMTKIHCARSP
jgi:hypothetical protein